MKKLLLMIFTLLLLNSIQAQVEQTIITGKVVDSENEPLAGVNILLKGTAVGTVTNSSGYYEVKSKDVSKAVLIFRFVGMTTQEISINGKKIINVTMSADPKMLNEVVSVGYANSRKADIAATVSSITAKEIENTPVATLFDALKGKIPGLVINSSDGSQESSISVRVRGGISVTQDNSPLFIVDGFPTENALSFLSPNDIERVDVLKDAAATAIYGSQGANGVIIITTKSGSVGKTKISYDTFYAFKSLGKKVDLLKPIDFVKYNYEGLGTTTGIASWEAIYGAFVDIEKNYADRKGIDWQEQMYGGVAVNQMHRLGLNGGSKDLRYNFSYSYNNDENMVPNSGMKSHTLLSRIDNNISQKISVGINLNYKYTSLLGVGPYSENGSKVIGLLKYRPTLGVYKNDEDLLNDDQFEIDENESDQMNLNPFTQLKSINREKKTVLYGGSMSAKWKILKDLEYSAQFGYNKTSVQSSTFYTAQSAQAKISSGPYGSVSQNDLVRFSGNHTLQWRSSFGKLKYDVLIGQELKEDISSSFSYGASSFPKDNFGVDYMGLGTQANLPSSDIMSNTMASFFGRANLQFNEKYILATTMRADGCSKFGTNNKWGYFPSGAFAWRAGEEPFIQNLNIFSNLKFRVSYGLAGNNRISNYQALSLYKSSWYPIESTSYTTFNPTLANSDLKWESNLTANVGLDMGFFSNRLSITIDAYKVNTSDLLLNSNIPYISGFDKCIRNIGETESKGLEISLNSVNFKDKDFNWDTNFNIAFNKNKVIKLADSNRWYIQSNSGGMSYSDYIIEVGQPTGLMWGFVSDGLYQADQFNFTNGKWVLKDGEVKSAVHTNPQPGFKKYKNLNPEEDNIVDTKDMKVIGNANPLFTGGITNTFKYKNIDFSFFCEFKYGGDIYNANIFNYVRTGKNGNTTKAVYDNHYTTIDETGRFLLNTDVDNFSKDVESLMRLNAGKTFPSINGGYIPFDSYMVEDGSYLRLTNITLGYSLPQKVTKKLKIENVRFYGTAYNVLVLSNYSGYDPEVSMNANSGLTPGIDRGSMPRSRNIVVGANIIF